MIQQEYKNNVQNINGEIETTEFSISINESMFQMLTSNVYNDPILAVMREWSTNACDACIAGNKEIAFDVHIPTTEEPEFSVRDYGTGLPPEDIVGLFSNLGASTKRNSDAYNGTFGIGRMAGLAVADAFTVESFYNGNLYSYVISMQNGVPTTMNMGSQPTQEPNGLKLSVAVDFDEIKHYVNKAGNLYKYFEHKPKLNRTDINITLDKSEHISDDWFIAKPTEYYDRTNYVVMSQVAYAIPYNSAIDTKGFQSLVIKVQPGEVSFNPGRESLSLNKKTIEVINQKFAQIEQEYAHYATMAFANSDNDYELYKTYLRVTDKAPSAISRKLDITPFISDTYKLFIKDTNNPKFSTLGLSYSFDADCNDLLTLAYKSSYRRSSKPITTSNPIQSSTFFNAIHIVVDIKTKYKKAIAELYESTHVCLWQRKGTADIEEAAIKAKEYLESMGIPYKLASELVSQETSTVKHLTEEREGLYASSIKISRYGTAITKSEKIENYTNGTFLYVKLNNTTPVDTDFEEIAKASYLLVRAGTVLPSVKGVPKKYQALVEELDNWVDFRTYVNEKMKETTFRLYAPHPVPRANLAIINNNTYKNYPKAIQEYYQELTNYKVFISDDRTLNSEDRAIAKKLGAKFESYEPTYDIDLNYLETVYPTSYPLLTADSYESRMIPTELVSKLAYLEEFYAIHSTKQQ